MIEQVVVFSRQGCKYCEKSKEQLERNKLDFKMVTLEDDYNGDKVSFRAAIEEKVPVDVTFSTLPQIFIGKRYIGGYDQLALFIGE